MPAPRYVLITGDFNIRYPDLSRNGPGPSRDYYQRKRAEGKRAVQAQIALARCRVNVLWVMIRTDTPRDPGRRADCPVAA
jgi:hypothetical protein